MNTNKKQSIRETIYVEATHTFVVDNFRNRIGFPIEFMSGSFPIESPLNEKEKFHCFIGFSFDNSPDFETVTVYVELMRDESSFPLVSIDHDSCRVRFQMLDEFERVKETLGNPSCSKDRAKFTVNLITFERFNQEVDLYVRPDGSVAIRCKITLNIGGRFLTKPSPNPNVLLAGNKVMPLDKRLKADSFPDVCLMSDGKRYPCHKHMLASCSNVFKAMFMTETTLSISNVVKIEDVEADVLEKLLEFVYSDRIETMEDMAIQLLYAADKYDMEDLKFLAGSKAVGELNCVNVCRYFIHGNLHHCDVLQSAALDFIENNFAKIRESADWAFLKCNNGMLLNEVLQLI